VFHWINICPECTLTRTAIRKGSELVYSWPVSSPFYIIHLDVWAPGDAASAYGFKYLLCAMCDLTGFIIITHVPDLSAATLAATFMTHVLLRVGFCGVVVPDAASSFKEQFKSMCTVLGIACSDAARGNHQAVSVEHFFRFLNKAMTVAIQTRGTNLVSVEAAHLAGYAWNASPIDGTDIIRSVAAVGRPFRFPVDTQLSAIDSAAITPVSSCNDLSSLHEYLRLGQSQSQFAVQILQLLTEERRITQSERVNEQRHPQPFQVGDTVTVRVQVHSNASTDTVAKLSYRRRGPYVVRTVLGNGSYELHRLHDPNGPVLKHSGQNMNLLPPSLFPCAPLDSADQRFLDLNYAPRIAPLQPHLGIEGFNEHWFSPDDAPAITFPPTIDIADPDQDVPAPVSAAPGPLLPLADAAAFATTLATSVDRLFFVSYRHHGTLRPKWYLVRADIIPATNSDPGSLVTGQYICHFHLPPRADNRLSHPDSRWWPLWHKYHYASDGVIVFGDQVEFPPRTRQPSPSKYVSWSDTLCLLDPTVRLLGPFDFNPPATNPRDRTPSYRQFVHHDIWASLLALCSDLGIIPPRLAPLPQPSRKRRLRGTR